MRLITCLLLLSATLSAQSRPDTIPFFLNSQNNICVRARVNQSDTLVLMLHSSFSGLTLTKEAATQKLQLNNTEKTQVRTWGGDAEGTFSTNNTLVISHLIWDSLTMFINELSGPGTDGKFGLDLLDDKIVSIDYDRMLLIVSDKLPVRLKKYRQIAMIRRGESLFLPGTLYFGKTVYRDTFMFHTGYGGSVLLDPKIREQYGLAESLTTISTSELKDAYGNVFKIETKLLPKLEVAGRKVDNVPLSFAARSSDIPMKVFGNGLLKKFNVVLDFQNDYLYMKRNGT